MVQHEEVEEALDLQSYKALEKMGGSFTLPETNIAHENPIFPGKSHQNGGFSMAGYVSLQESIPYLQETSLKLRH